MTALGIDQGVLPSLRLELAAGVLIGEVDDLELPGVDVEDGPHEDVLEGDAGVLALLEEGPLVLDIILGRVSGTMSMFLSFM